AMAQVGEYDARYIRKILRLQRLTEVGGRGLLFLGFNPLAWVSGSFLLGISKILDNMEIGHNVMHGQYDWMNDPRLHSNTFEWDTACDSDSWRRTHNYEHHTYTNILGKDRDYGYGVLRLTHDEEFRPEHRLQFISYVLLSVFFQWGVSLHEMEADRIYKGEVKLSDKKPIMKAIGRKGARQAFKDYVFFPLLTGPLFLHTLAGNATANLIRNLWASTVIFCGHFPEGVQTFDLETCENESRGHWYYRQMLGSANFQGRRWLHIMSGHLSYQIEHHLFPDIPAHRYAEMSPKVQAVAEKYGLPYNTGPFWRQYMTVVQRIIKHSKPAPKQKEVAAA
ncbi:MAG: fatty acid desaturase family protein, partial [Pseudomonadota bacterium]